jgi:methylenetetrahydrofolate dehydrogenase (NADP+)/methenyltetrahydrofolate cyclohydrolase
MAQLLLKESCTVTIAHSRTKNIEEICKNADIVVAAVGRPKMVKGDWIKKGAVVIDVGINRITIEVEGELKINLLEMLILMKHQRKHQQLLQYLVA